MISATLTFALLSSPAVTGTSPFAAHLQADAQVVSAEAMFDAATELEAFAEGEAEAEVVRTEYWAGHQVVFGTREVPVLGTLQTRMDTYVIARVRRSESEIQIDERACKVDYVDVGGVKIYVDPAGLPDSRVVYERVEGTPHYAMSGTLDWGREDVDEDGKPGMRVYIDAPVCSGNLHVSNRTTTIARAFGDDEGTPIRGEVTLNTHQRILDAEGKCLSAVAKDSYERSQGKFRYTKVKANATCSSLLDAGWPTKAG